MASSGPRYPGTAASLANAGTSENAEAWVSPTNVGADDGTTASVTAATYDNNDITQLLVASNFGFAIPTGSTITGILVEIDRNNAAGAAHDFRVQLATGTTFANLVGNNKATATDWPASLTSVSYGGENDMWGTSLTVSQINASGFSVMVSAIADGNNTDVAIDYIRVTVYYYSVAGSFTADAHIKGTISGSFTANAHISGTVSGSFTADAQIAGDGKRILYVVSDATTPLTPDVTLRDWMVSLGHTVTYISDETAEADSASYDLAIISESCAAATVGNKYKTWPKPVLVNEIGVWDDHDLAAAGSILTAQSQFDILEAGDPIAAGLTGTVTFTTSGTTDICYAASSSWGPGAVLVIGTVGSTTQIVAGRYERGSTGTNSFVFPARRAALGYNQNTINHNNFDDTELRAIYSATIDWLTAPANDYEAAVLEDNPVFFAPMVEPSGNIADIVGGKIGTANGTPTYAETGPFAGVTGISFNNIADFFSFADHADLDLGDGPFTIEFWLRRDADNNNQQGVVRKGTNGYAVNIVGTNDKLGLGQQGVGFIATTTDTIPTNSSWHHYVITYNGGTTGIWYIDAATNTTQDTSRTLANTTSAMEVGRDDSTLDGALYGLAIYKSILSSTRVSAHYSAAGSTQTYSGSFTADAHISKTDIAGSFTANANIAKNDIAGTFTADAYVKKLDIAGSFTADANIKNTIAGSFTADAHISKNNIAGSFTADAFIKKLDIPGSFTADAHITKTWSGTFTADAYIRQTFAGSFVADSNIKATVASTFTADAYIFKTIPGSFTADAQIANVVSGSFTANAHIAGTPVGSFTADANISKLGIPGTFTADAYIKRLDIPGSFVADAYIRQTFSGSLTADAYIRSTLAGTFTADSFIRNTIASTFTADAYVLNVSTGSWTADAHISKVNIPGSFSADAHIVNRYSGSFTADAHIDPQQGTTFNGSFTADAHIKSTVSGTLTADAYIRQTFSGSFSADAYIKQTYAAAFTADAYIKNTFGGSFSAQAYIFATTPGAFTADAYIMRITSGTFTADSHISATVAGTFTATAHISNPFAVLVVDSVHTQGPTFRVRTSKSVSLVGTVSQGPSLVARTEQE